MPKIWIVKQKYNRWIVEQHATTLATTTKEAKDDRDTPSTIPKQAIRAILTKRSSAAFISDCSRYKCAGTREGQ